MSDYKWNNPCEWLTDAAKSWPKDSVYNALCLVAQKTDPDTLQDIFQREMDEDGYFILIKRRNSANV